MSYPLKMYKNNAAGTIQRILRLCLLIPMLLLGAPALAQDSGDPSGDTSLLVHVVQPGETLDSVAELYAVAPDAILEANGLAIAAEVGVGQRLVIPQLDSSMLAVRATVGIGDTLFGLARRYDVSPETLARINRVVNPSLLYAGQTLIVPPASHARTLQVGLAQISREDTIWHIALRSDVNYIALVMQNGVPNPAVVEPGRLLAVPGVSDSGSLLSGAWSSMLLRPLPLQAGRSASLIVESKVPGTLSGSFLGSDLRFVSEGLVHYALLGVNRWTAPGPYPLTLNLQKASGASQSYTRQVLVTDGGYTHEVIRLSDEDSSLLSESQAVQEEGAYIRQIMSGFTPERYWEGLFRLPASGVMSSGYGTVRSYNGGGYNSFHGGTDFVARTGTPVYAPADGVVVDAGMLDVRGFFTVIDHGWGVYSGYWHQSTILVNPGDSVVAGQQIGTIGNTGLSTATHLHWELWVSGNQVDPLQWAREIFP